MTDRAILDFAKLAQLVYTDPPQFGTDDGPACGRMYGGVLVFRGTDNGASLMADLDITTMTTKALGAVHKGFMEALEGVLPQLMELPPPTAIVGHSEGAALATLHAGLLCVSGRLTFKAVYGFEPPRFVADGTLNGVLNMFGIERFYTCNGSDPVPDFPLELSLPGQLTFIGAKRTLIPDIDDHYIANVVKSLEAAA